MNKLYYVVCEEKGATLFEGRFQGQTRGMAMKFLKEKIGRPSLAGTVFTITEIPVTVIREIVEAIMKGEPVTAPAAAPAVEAAAEAVPAAGSLTIVGSQNSKVMRFDPFQNGEPPVDEAKRWAEIRRFYRECRSPKKTADRFCLSVNTVKARIHREGW